MKFKKSELYSKDAEFKIRLTGNRAKDEELCWTELGITDATLQEKIKKSFVWHHLDDLNENLECTMQLAPVRPHKKARHRGGAWLYDELFGTKIYNTKN